MDCECNIQTGESSYGECGHMENTLEEMTSLIKLWKRENEEIVEKRQATELIN